MKARLSVSRKHLIKRNRGRYYFNYRTALQLYSIYKAEAVINNEPRIPLNDPRRPVPSSKHSVVFISYLKQQITSCISSIKASGNDLHHTLASLLRN
jgi:hypothetical protein